MYYLECDGKALTVHGIWVKGGLFAGVSIHFFTTTAGAEEKIKELQAKKIWNNEIIIIEVTLNRAKY